MEIPDVTNEDQAFDLGRPFGATRLNTTYAIGSSFQLFCCGLHHQLLGCALFPSCLRSRRKLHIAKAIISPRLCLPACCTWGQARKATRIGPKSEDQRQKKRFNLRQAGLSNRAAHCLSHMASHPGWQVSHHTETHGSRFAPSFAFFREFLSCHGACHERQIY